MTSSLADLLRGNLIPLDLETFEDETGDEDAHN
jgi:hypothetical protein